MGLSKINGTQHCLSKFVLGQHKDFSNEITQEEIEEILCDILNTESFTRSKCLKALKKIQSLRCKRNGLLYEILESYAKRFCQQCCKKIFNGCSEDVINTYVKTWISYDEFSKNVNTVFSPINRQAVSESITDCISPSNNVEFEANLTVYSFMLRNWSVVVNEMKDLLSEGIFTSMEKERNGEIYDRKNDILKELHDSVIKVGLSNTDDEENDNELYRMTIEKPILQKLEVYYANESKKYFLFLSDDDAIVKCSEIIKQEEKILKKFLPRSADLIRKRAWDIYISDNINRIIERAIYYIQHKEFERLKIAYACLMMSENINNKIQEREEKIFINLRETCETTKFCECFLKTYAQEHHLLRSVFDSKPLFDALDEGVSRAFCKNMDNGDDSSKESKIVCGLQVSEILVNDIDLFMKNETNELLNTKMEKKMEDVMFMLKYIKDKNEFIQLYSVRLAQRLIFSTSKSEKAEEKMINKISLSKSQLEKAYLKELNEFYTLKSLELMDVLDVKDYVEMCLWLLEKEVSKSQRFLPTSNDKILNVLRKILVFDNVDFIKIHFRIIIEDQNVKALKNAYKLLHFENEAINHMLNEYQNYIERKIVDIFKNFKEDDVVDSLVGFHMDQSKFFEQNFSSYSGFFESLDKGFRNATNRFSQDIDSSRQMLLTKCSSFSDILVTHCDKLLKGGANEQNEMDGKLTGIITLFKYIDDKDSFNKLYAVRLAQRLINSTSKSEVAEEKMIKNINLSKSQLEKAYLKELNEFYTLKSLELMDVLDVKDYVEMCLWLLEKEVSKSQRFLPTSNDKILNVLRKILVFDNVDFIKIHFRIIIEDQNVKALKNAYKLLHFENEAINHMLNEYQNYIERKIVDIFKNFKEDDVVDSLVGFHMDQSKFFEQNFSSYSGFFESLDKGFRNAINRFSQGIDSSRQMSLTKCSSLSDILVTHCDKLLKGGANEQNEMDGKLTGIITLFKYIDDKDSFNKLYAVRLAQRLINSTSKSEVAEEKMIKNINLSKSQLEKAYLKELNEFYTLKSLELMDVLDVKDYVEMCLWLLEKEVSKSKRFLPTSNDKILNVLRKILVFDNVDFIKIHFRIIIEDQNVKALKNAYKLLHFENEAINHMLNEYQNYIERKIVDIFKNFKEDDVVDSLVGFHMDQSKFFEQNFSSYSGFFESLDKGFRNAINRFSQGIDSSRQMSLTKCSSLSDILVTHCDKLLKGGANEQNEMDGKLTRIITLFKCIDNKDIFNKLYSKALALRLLQSSSLFIEAEQMMIKKLKQVCDYQFVTLLEKMLKDDQESKKITLQFNNGYASPISFNISVIQTGIWPIQACKLSPLIPRELSAVMTEFNKFYGKSYRKLHWHHTLSTCDIKLHYLSKTYIIQTSVIITTILTIFNNMESATFNDIKSSTEIDAKDLLKHLQFLSTHELLLCGDGINSEVTEESAFSLNYKYVSKRENIRLVPVFMESKQEAKEIRTVLSDQKYYLQALIVRIMKAKKKSTHSDLVNEVIRESMSNFVPTQVFIKDVINFLIDKEYLTPIDGRSDMYHYLA